MKSLVALGALTALLVPSISLAAQACPDRTPLAVTAVPEAGLKCQQTMSKEGAKFVKTKMKELGKCRLKEPTGTCPTATNVEKIEKAANKAAEKIAKECGPDAAQDALTSSYGGGTDDAVISSCMLSQHSVDAEVLVGHFTGITTENAFADNDPKLRDKCVKELSKLGQKYVDGAMKLARKCIDKAMQDGVAGNLSDLCIGHYAGGVLIPPTDDKTEEGLLKLTTKTEDAIDKKCADPVAAAPGGVPFGTIQSIFACAGSGTVADLKKCVVCEAWDGTLDLLEQQYAESHDAVVSPGADAIQTAVSAASVGDKIFITSGTYSEDVTVATDGLKLIGCGSATNARPYIPRSQGNVRGIQATGSDDLVFQSLKFFDWNDDAIFVAQANGVAFRDIVDDGNLNTRYAVFPVQSTNVLVEACDVRRDDDAPIYVGQSEDITVRFNHVREAVAAIEIENCEGAFVHNNISSGNTAGMLVFKDPNLPDQDSHDHVVVSNVLQDNNTPNFGSGFVANVPRGTGMLVFSTDDSLFQGNIVRGNNQFGIVLVDQILINALAEDPNDPPFPSLSPDQTSEGNKVRRNALVSNATLPDNEDVFGDRVFGLGDDVGGNHNNCLTPNAPVTITAFLTPEDCTP
jgi:parallel beta-helix repeat protein